MSKESIDKSVAPKLKEDEAAATAEHNGSAAGPLPHAEDTADESVAFLPHSMNKTAIVYPNKNQESLPPAPPPFTPPDGGLRAWSVMVAAFLVNGLLFGTINSGGVIFKELEAQLEAQGVPNPASRASLCLSLTIGMTFLLSLLSGVLTDRLGIRLTTFLGGATATLGVGLSALVYQNISLLTLTFGFMLGVGGSLAYTPSLVILGHYFRARMGVVNGVVTAGSSLFTILMPWLFQRLLAQHGLGLLFGVLAAMVAPLMAFALVFKPLLPPPPPPPPLPSSSSPSSRILAFLSSVLNFEIWKNRKFVIWAVCIPLALFGYFVPYVHLVAYTKDVLGEDVKAETLVQCIGATSGVGRLVFGFVADLPGVNRIVLQQVSFVCIGVLTMLLTAWHNYWFFLCLSLGMGLFDGCFISLLGPVAFDIVGPSGAPQAIGSLLALCSVPLTFGPVGAAMLKEALGDYTWSFRLAGLPPLLGAAAMCAVHCVPPPHAKPEMELADVEEGKRPQ